MIPGIVAASGGSSSGGSSYPDAVAVADFILGQYFIDGNQVTAAAMVANPEFITGPGLYINWDVAGYYTRAIGDFLTKLIATDWTTILEVTEDDAGTMHPLTLADENTGGADLDSLIFSTAASSVSCTDDPDPGSSRFVSVGSVAARPAVRRIAATRTNAKLVISVNGSAINSDTTATSTPSYNKAILGADDGDTFPFMKGHIRRIIVYPVKADSELPALSTP